MLPIALPKAVPQQCCTTPLVAMQNFDADQRKVPMRFGWPVIFRPLEDGGDFGLPFLSNGFCDNRFERPVIAVSTRWEPDRDPDAVVGTLRCSCFKRACSEGSG